MLQRHAVLVDQTRLLAGLLRGEVLVLPRVVLVLALQVGLLLLDAGQLGRQLLPLPLVGGLPLPRLVHLHLHVGQPGLHLLVVSAHLAPLRLVELQLGLEPGGLPLQAVSLLGHQLQLVGQVAVCGLGGAAGHLQLGHGLLQLLHVLLLLLQPVRQLAALLLQVGDLLHDVLVVVLLLGSAVDLIIQLLPDLGALLLRLPPGVHLGLHAPGGLLQLVPDQGEVPLHPHELRPRLVLALVGLAQLVDGLGQPVRQVVRPHPVRRGLALAERIVIPVPVHLGLARGLVVVLKGL